MSWIEFFAFVLTIAGIWMVGTTDHKVRNRGFAVGALASLTWIGAALSKGLFFWWGATNVVLLGVYLRGWFRTRPFAKDA
jgi:hypothetical protein